MFVCRLLLANVMIPKVHREVERFKWNSTFFSAFSLSRCIEIGHRQSGPVDECSEEKREGLGREKIHTGRNFMADERENARERNIRCCIYNTTLRKIDRMALFIPSHLLSYVRG